MVKILEALATDNLSLDPAIYAGSTEYQKTNNLFCNLGEKLLEKSNPEEQKLFEDYNDAFCEQEHLYSIDKFVNGYRLGVLMTLEVFNGYDNLITKKNT